MKALTSYTRVTGYMNKIWKAINTEFFDDELEMPTLTLQSSGGASYGHITTERVWHTEDGRDSYEINLSIDYLQRPIELLCCTLVHEGIHMLAMLRNVKDTSNRGVYHNKNFLKLSRKDNGESRGVVISRHDTYGWTITEPDGDIMTEFCLKHGFDDLKISRDGFGHIGTGTPKAGNGTDKPKVKKPSSTRKIVCPVCGQSVRATKKVNILCGDCMVKMVEVE